MGFIINLLLFLIALFLILLVLVQRGRGGGLAGALGGMGGQSAFGTKAGDVFTRVTIIVAALWIVLCAMAVKYFQPDDVVPFGGTTSVAAPSAVPEGALPPVSNPTPGNTPAPGAPGAAAPEATGS